VVVAETTVEAIWALVRAAKTAEETTALGRAGGAAARVVGSGIWVGRCQR
jgi:hypothetical protein